MHEMNLRHSNRKIDAFLGEPDCFRLVQSGKASYAGYLTWDDHSSIQPQVALLLCVHAAYAAASDHAPASHAHACTHWLAQS